MRTIMLTDVQFKVYDFVKAYVAKHGKGPLLREVGDAVGITSRGTVHRHMSALIDEGYIDKPLHGWRSVKVVEDDSQSPSDFTLPLLGRIAAGLPIEAIPDQSEISLSDMFVGTDRYALQVSGDSMMDAGILDGDIVVIREQKIAREGDIVVALVDGADATLKRFAFAANGDVKLIPENANMDPMYFPPQRVEIQGVLVGQMRFY